MTQKYSSSRPGLLFTKMDIEKMTFGDGEFNVILDKGTLDALMPDDTDETLKKAHSILAEIGRVLKVGGRYLCVSLLQEHILRTILRWCTDQGWLLRIHRCLDAEEAAKSKSQSNVFPIFVVVCTKMKKIPGQQFLVFEYAGGESTNRMQCPDELYDAVHSVQQYALLKHNLNTKKWVGEEVSIDFYLSSGTPEPRYQIFVVDQKEKLPTKFAVFIVPQGRETDWIFSTKEGRTVLVESAKSQRLLVVHLDRNHSYESLDQVKSELSQKVMEFAPPQFDYSQQVPFLSLGENVGQRTLVYRGNSQTTGDYIVEDVQGDGDNFFRRLVFLSNPNVIQSEALLVVTPATKKKKQKSVDAKYLACEHHKYMALGAAMKPTGSRVSALLVGLGGGNLASYMQRYLTNVHLHVVEIDAEIVSIATKWFDLDVSSDRLDVHVGDGLDFIRAAASNGEHYDVVMLDVDNKDSSSGLSVPPPEFLEKDFLCCIQTIIDPNGMLILNLACRDSNLKSAIFSRLRELFLYVYVKIIPKEVNRVIYAWSQEGVILDDLLQAKPLLNHLGIEEVDDWFKPLELENM